MTCFIQFKPTPHCLCGRRSKPTQLQLIALGIITFTHIFRRQTTLLIHLTYFKFGVFFATIFFKGKQLPHISLSLNGSVKYLTFQSEVNPIRPYSCGEVIGKSGRLTNLNATL